MLLLPILASARSLPSVIAPYSICFEQLGCSPMYEGTLTLRVMPILSRQGHICRRVAAMFHLSILIDKRMILAR